MPPNDLGDFYQVSENCRKLSVDDLVRQANSQLKRNWLTGQIEVLGVKVSLVASKTGFGGERLWFMCPVCRGRVGKLYEGKSGQFACRKCLGIKYAKSRYKGMVEIGLK
jgi:hypothetical protein